jgi:hypothetical protein
MPHPPLARPSALLLRARAYYGAKGRPGPRGQWQANLVSAHFSVTGALLAGRRFVDDAGIPGMHKRCWLEAPDAPATLPAIRRILDAR